MVRQGHENLERVYSGRQEVDRIVAGGHVGPGVLVDWELENHLTRANMD
jgi:hypothetical protein